MSDKPLTDITFSSFDLHPALLAGLEGAIRGVRWHAIPPDEREALWRKYQASASRLSR